MNNALKNLLRPHYLKLEGYISAGMEETKSEDKIFLNANENPYALPRLEGLNRYPEPQAPALREAYARTYGVQSDQIVMTRGADEAITLLTKLFCEPHQDQILICPPTFGMYSVDAHSLPAGVVEVPLQKEQGSFTLDKDGIIKSVLSSPRQAQASLDSGDTESSIKLVFLCSPNNPTGTSFPRNTISEICKALEGRAVVILDEAYTEFSNSGSMCDALSAAPNLIILRTLSKAYALAGMRMGCLIAADTDFTALIRAKALAAYPLPRASIEAALRALSPEISQIAKNNIAKIIAERKRMETALKQSPEITHIYPSDANFLLIEMKRANEFHAFAAENNMLLRNFSAQSHTENCLRLSIGTPEENDKLLQLLTTFASR